ncbi:MAG TPA: hypothetical protein VNZ03_06640 [Terriglobales bacterium]|nr:hypothetical protein [Terriglobales bacterium]
MKDSRQSSKTSCDLPDSVNHRLNMYALAASAAGVLIASAQSTEAKIIYTPAHVTIRLHDSYKLDLNHDGIADFTVLNTSYHNTSTWFYRLSEKAAQGNGVEASVSHTFQREVAEALRRGARIPGSHAFYHKPALLASAVYNPGGTFSDGNWVNVNGRYLGLRFKIKGQTHYGWARLSVQVSGTTVTGTLTGYAYETIPNKPIIAGKTISSDEIDSFEQPGPAPLSISTLESAMLAALAMGTPGLSIWRRKESLSGN